MQAPINQEALVEKWAPLLDYDGPVSYTHLTLPPTPYV